MCTMLCALETLATGPVILFCQQLSPSMLIHDCQDLSMMHASKGLLLTHSYMPASALTAPCCCCG
jgi:hypothetical protein